MTPKEKDKDHADMLYKCPGPHNAGALCADGYKYAAAKSPEDAERMMKQGWSKTLPEAADKYAAEKDKAKAAK